MLLDCLYAVCCVDKSVSSAEDHEMRNISRELKLGHQDYIDARLTYREQLAVVRKPTCPEKS